MQNSIQMLIQRDYSEIPMANNTQSFTLFSSPLISYYNSSIIYLNRKYSENNNILDIDKSNNFIRKDSLIQNDNEENKTSESDNIQKKNIYDHKIINMNIIEKEEYNQLKPNGNYYQTYQDNLFSSNNRIIYNNNAISNNINQINQNQQNEIQINSQNNQIMNLNVVNHYNLIQNNNLINRPTFNSTNIINGNFMPPIFSTNILKNNNNNNNNLNNNLQNNTLINNGEMNGRKGWTCSFCNNFNYESRNKCNRCKQTKSQIISPKKKNIGNGIRNSNKNNFENKGQKSFSEREGDWICFNCKNVNFAFRIICNRCQLPKIDSEKLLQLNFNLMSNKIDSNNKLTEITNK